MIPLSIYAKKWKKIIITLVGQLNRPVAQIDIQRIIIGFVVEGHK